MSTDERARLVYATIEAFGWRIDWPHDKPVPDDAWPIDIIRRHIEAAVEDRLAVVRSWNEAPCLEPLPPDAGAHEQQPSEAMAEALRALRGASGG